MADTVNPQITDMVTMSSNDVVAQAPAMAMASVYQAYAQALAIAAQNAANAQNNGLTVLQATTTQAVNLLLTPQD